MRRPSSGSGVSGTLLAHTGSGGWVQSCRCRLVCVCACVQDSEREAKALLADEHKKAVRGYKTTIKTQTEQIGKLQGDVQKYGHKRLVIKNNGTPSAS